MTNRLLTGLLFGLLLFSGHLSASCGDRALSLSDVQGDGAASPLAGKTVTVEGVITQDSRQPGGWRGFYLQQLSGKSDHNPHTSDALFVYTDRPGGTEGTVVRVTGQVKEYHGLTELTRVSDVILCGSASLPKAIPIQLPWPGQTPPEHLENMRVVFTQPLTLIGHHNFARYGELILADVSQVIPTEFIEPGPDALALIRQQSLNRVHLDDGRSARNPQPLPWPAPLLGEGSPVRAGDRLTGLTGVLDYRFSHWRLQPSGRPRLTESNKRPEAPARPTDSTLRVVTLNLGNFFNGDGSGSGFADGRGARNAGHFAHQTSRLTAVLTRLDADVIAVAEMENDHYGPASAIAELATALGSNWRYVTTAGTIPGTRSAATGTDAIRTDLLYRADRVQTVGNPQRLNHGTFAHRGRPPLAQVFRPIQSQSMASVRIVAPHFKSKACGGAKGENRDQDDGQGCYAHRRVNEATALAEWLETLNNPEHFAGTLVTGDLNSYAREWPITRLQDAGLTNLIRARQRCQPEDCPATTYRYQGRHGSLDYTLASEPLLNRVVDAGVWMINASEFRATGYQGPVKVPADAPWRASDHNPIYTDLAL